MLIDRELGMRRPPTVHILLATYNGELFLTEQLESIARQKHRNWTLTVSDDGSTDKTLAIVKRFASKVEQPVYMLKGPQKGSSTANFVNLISLTEINNDLDLYAFCDQDDVWDEEKLAYACHWHAQHTSAAFRLYCGRTTYVNEQLTPIGISPDLKQAPSFGNALVQNIASGNTMVFNSSVLFYLKKVLPEHYVWHDWTTYLTATAMNGLIYFDKTPRVLYRQHSLNVIGSNDDHKAFIKSIKAIYHGRYKHWLDLTTLCVLDFAKDAPSNSIRIFNEFMSIRSHKSALITIMKFLASKNIRRQGLLSNIIFAIALFFKFA